MTLTSVHKNDLDLKKYLKNYVNLLRIKSYLLKINGVTG